MLKHLSIRNYILIRDLEIAFGNGFTAITGETGAGKSIFLGALGLLLGERADVTALSDKTGKCIVEGTFDVSSAVDEKFFNEHELDYDPNCIIRREIHPQGKSRAFINDTPVGLHVLKHLSEKLIDIHSQHSTILLAKNSFHLALLDAVAGTSDMYENYQREWNEYKQNLSSIEELKSSLEAKEKEKDYLSFLFNEIDELAPKENENQILENDLAILQNAEKIKSTLLEASHTLKYSDNTIVQQLQLIADSTAALKDVFPQISDTAARIKSASIEIDDIATELTSLEDKIQIDPERITVIEERLDSINRLLLKHKASTTQELLILREDMNGKIAEIDLCSDTVKVKEELAKTQLEELKNIAAHLSEKRTAITPGLERDITEILSSLAMPHAQFKVQNTKNEQPDIKGYDQISFFFSANKGEQPQELSRVASGGEMSRVMLALKSVIARSSNLPTLIFDEIDTGVSGETAKKMAGIFAEMGNAIQLIVITHLPQIAARSQKHLMVSKQETQSSTYTVIEHLDEKGRISAIAQMLDGENYSEHAWHTAKELMESSLGVD